MAVALVQLLGSVLAELKQSLHMERFGHSCKVTALGASTAMLQHGLCDALSVASRPLLVTPGLWQLGLYVGYMACWSQVDW